MKKATFQSSGNATNSHKSSSNSGGHSCLCSPTTHVVSFRCRLHRQSCNSQVRIWTNAKTVGNNVFQDKAEAKREIPGRTSELRIGKKIQYVYCRQRQRQMIYNIKSLQGDIPMLLFCSSNIAQRLKKNKWSAYLENFNCC